MHRLRLPKLRLEHGGEVLFTFMVVATYILVFNVGRVQFAPLEAAGFILLGIVYLLVGTWGAGWIEQRGTPRTKLLFFSVGFGLAFAINWVSRGDAWLILMPLVGQCVISLSRPWMVFSLFLVLGVALAPYWPYLTNLRSIGQLLIGMISGIGFVAVFTEVAQRETRAKAEIERLAKELGSANSKLREYATQVEELATTRERNRLAREIHDGLGHYLTVVNVQLEAAKALLDRDPSRAREAVAKAQTLTQEGLAEVRRSVASLRTLPTESHTLPEAIQLLVDETRAVGIATDLVVSGAARPLSPQADLTLYRAAQEGLTNVRKHAQASEAHIALDYSPANVALRVHDNGVGLNGHGVNGVGFGLLGVRERVGLLGGAVRTEAQVGQGFMLEVELPA